MSFLAKLKERLFKSSSKIEEGLETIIDSAPTSLENTKKNAIELNIEESHSANVDHTISQREKEKKQRLSSDITSVYVVKWFPPENTKFYFNPYIL